MPQTITSFLSDEKEPEPVTFEVWDHTFNQVISGLKGTPENTFSHQSGMSLFRSCLDKLEQAKSRINLRFKTLPVVDVAIESFVRDESGQPEKVGGDVLHYLVNYMQDQSVKPTILYPNPNAIIYEHDMVYVAKSRIPGLSLVVIDDRSAGKTRHLKLVGDIAAEKYLSTSNMKPNSMEG